MCGIALIIHGVRFDLSSLLINSTFPVPKSEQLVFTIADLRAALRRRGPDSLGSWKLLLHSTVSSCLPELEIASSIEEVKEESCSEDERNCFSLANGRTESQFSTMPSSAAELHFFGASLQLRGISPIVQPLIDSSKNILLYNGEIFGGLDIGGEENDGEVLLQLLGECRSCSPYLHKTNHFDGMGEGSVPDILSRIKGPWAIIYWQESSKILWFGRDAFGRRSLLVHWPTVADSRFLLSSVSPVSSDFEAENGTTKLNFWEELPCGIYSISIDAPKLDGLFLGEVKKHEWTNAILEELIKWERTSVEPKPEELHISSSKTLTRKHDLHSVNSDALPSKSGPMQASNSVLAQTVLMALKESVMRRSSLHTIFQAGRHDVENELVPVAVLFSGGLDSMIIAALLHECLDPSYDIDLLNVSFDGREFDLLTEIVSNCRESNWNLEMATYTEFHQPDIASDRQHSQDVSISQILDHGSISFGRFAVESLAWEKWSVFRHNRCQEELEMYKSNGLVAQKKAYFEDYYKRVRGRKALQVQHQETTQPDPCPDVRINTTQLEYENCHDLSKQETCGNDTVANSDLSLGTIVDKPRQAKQQPLNDCNDNTDKVIMADEANNTLSNVEPEEARIDASLSPTPSITSSSGAAQHDSLVSDPVKNDADKPKKHTPPVLKAKVNAALPRNKSKLDCRITKDAVKSLEKSKPCPLHVTSKRDNHFLPCKCNTRGAASENNSNHVSSRKKLTEVCSSVTVPHPSSTRSRLVPSYPSGRSDPKKANSYNKKLADRLQTNLPVHARSVQNTSNEKSIACGLKNRAVEKRSCIGVSRKLLDLGNQQMRRKVGQSENQRPKSMFTNNPAHVDSERKNYGKEGKEKEGKEENNAANRRYPKPSSTATSSVHKNVKVVHKIAELKSGILPRA